MARIPNEHALGAAARQDDIARITALIESGADVNGAAPKTGYTPLMWAKSAVATRTLINAGASVHARDQQGHTPLMWVISKNNVPDQAAQIAQELIDAGADVNVRDDNGKTPLYWARFHRDRLREPRLQRIAEQLVSILKNATDNLVARRQTHLETLATIADQVGEFELAIARMANDPAMDVSQAPELLGRAGNGLGDVRELLRQARRDVIEH